MSDTEILNAMQALLEEQWHKGMPFDVNVGALQFTLRPRTVHDARTDTIKLVHASAPDLRQQLVPQITQHVGRLVANKIVKGHA